MDIKAWLKRMDRLLRLVGMHEARAANLRARIEYKSPSFDGIGGGTPNPARNSIRLAELMDLEAKIEEESRYLAEMRARAVKMFNSLDKPEMQYIFTSRYLDGLSWNEIIESAGLSESWVYDLHGRGLNILRERFGSQE